MNSKVNVDAKAGLDKKGLETFYASNPSIAVKRLFLIIPGGSFGGMYENGYNQHESTDILKLQENQVFKDNSQIEILLNYLQKTKWKFDKEKMDIMVDFA